MDIQSDTTDLQRGKQKKHKTEIPRFFVYILRTSSNTLYIGQTNNLQRRLKQHNSHTSASARYLRMFTSFAFVYSETYNTRTESMKREAQLKTWPRAKKEALIGSAKV